MAPKLLLDRPASEPALGVGDIAGRFASLIESSDPGFAIGIFGEWGAGKTTLIQSIRARLSTDLAIPVAFHAWRYEREPELLIPLLDTIRQALLDWAGLRPDTADVERVRKAARRIARVARGLLSGVSAEVGVPGAAKVKYDVGAALEVAGTGDAGADGPQSLYFAGFRELSEAVGDAMEGGVDRIVVLIDDLDRCLPATAVAVLEAVKLFFDLPGFIFVVGLDDDVIEDALLPKMWPIFVAQAIDTAMAPAGQPDPGVEAAVEHARSHFKKVFQVMYEVPGVTSRQIDELLGAMVSEAELESGQRGDLDQRVRPYLSYLERAGRINPRRVKQFINSYTLATLLRPELDPDLVLAVNTIASRIEWAAAERLMRATPAAFVDAIERYRVGDGAGLRTIWPADQIVPPSFAAFAISDQAEPLTRTVEFEAYLPPPEPTGSSQRPTSAEAEFEAIHLLLDEIRHADITDDQLSRLRSDVGSRIAHLPAFIPARAPWGMHREFTAEVDLVLRASDDEPDTPSDLADRLSRDVSALEHRLALLQEESASATMFW